MPIFGRKKMKKTNKKIQHKLYIVSILYILSLYKSLFISKLNIILTKTVLSCKCYLHQAKECPDGNFDISDCEIDEVFVFIYLSSVKILI